MPYIRPDKGLGDLQRTCEEAQAWLAEEKQMKDANENEALAAEEKSTLVSLTELLESKPPNVYYRMSVFKKWGDGHFTFNLPELQLYCGSEACGGTRFFQAERSSPFTGFVTESDALIGKLGEIPPFGPPTPSRVISLIGPDREIFLKGRRAEIDGLGIGAFAYYRRVVENQKGRIIAEIAKVAARLGAKQETLKQFEKALTETQFSSAIDDIKDGIPQSLLIGGHNPLTLLHSALSEGLHEHTDEECLQIASSIRIVMTELADRISIALKDEAELNTAVSRLLNRHKS